MHSVRRRVLNEPSMSQSSEECRRDMVLVAGKRVEIVGVRCTIRTCGLCLRCEIMILTFQGNLAMGRFLINYPNQDLRFFV